MAVQRNLIDFSVYLQEYSNKYFLNMRNVRFKVILNIIYCHFSLYFFQLRRPDPKPAADMPGVAADGVNIELRDGVLTLDGDVKPWEGPDESDVLVEFEIGKYYRQFTLSDAIDQNKIDAKLEDGVLRLTLPKAQKAVPRQITVTAG